MIGKVIRGEMEAEFWYVGTMKFKEAASYLGISQYMLRKWVKENKVPYTKFENNRFLFHKKILDAWKKGEFPVGRVELVLDEESIEFDHEEALEEHYERYPELKEKKIESEKISKPLAHSNIEYWIEEEKVYLKVNAASEVEVTVSLTHAAVKELYDEIRNLKGKNNFA